MSDRSVHLAPGVERGGWDNERTVCVSLPGLRVKSGRTGELFLADTPDMPFEELFVNHYDDLRTAFARHAHEPGVFIAAIVPGFGLRGHLWLAAGEETRSAILGRHEHADLFLPDDPSLALRHLAVLVRREETELRVRVLDLRTGSGFFDEAGRQLQAVSADGPLLLRASAHRFFLLPTGPGRELAADAREAWRALPQRRFEDGRVGDAARAPDVPGERPPRWRVADEVTVVTAEPSLFEPPAFLELTEPGEEALGHLVVHVGGRQARVALGAAKARRGVIVGRYSRCDGVCPGSWLPESVSRVHAIVLLERDRLYIVDAGSTNGTTLRGARIDCAAIPARETVRLADAELVWEPAA